MIETPPDPPIPQSAPALNIPIIHAYLPVVAYRRVCDTPSMCLREHTAVQQKAGTAVLAAGLHKCE